MKRAFRWIWNQGILSTFLTGLFAILPLLLTIVILAWVASYLQAVFGPSGLIGKPLQEVGFQLVSDEATAWIVGMVIVLVGIWVLGVVMKSVLRSRAEQAFNAVIDRIPIFSSIYRTSAQLVGMLRQKDQPELAGMSVVFCSFGQQHGSGLLCLQVSPEVYRFGEREYCVVYIPTSPIPMTGGLVFVPRESIRPVAMSVDQVMRIYLSMGILAPQVMPEEHHPAKPVLEPDATASTDPAGNGE